MSGVQDQDEGPDLRVDLQPENKTPAQQVDTWWRGHTAPSLISRAFVVHSFEIIIFCFLFCLV